MKHCPPLANFLTAALWRAASAFELASSVHAPTARESEEDRCLA